jgi:hypothetical protein
MKELQWKSSLSVFWHAFEKIEKITVPQNEQHTPPIQKGSLLSKALRTASIIISSEKPLNARSMPTLRPIDQS